MILWGESFIHSIVSLRTVFGLFVCTILPCSMYHFKRLPRLFSAIVLLAAALIWCDLSASAQPPPPAFQLGNIGFGSALVSPDYSNLNPSWGPSQPTYGLSAGLMTSPFCNGAGSSNFGPSFGLLGGYHTYSTTSTFATNTSTSTTTIWSLNSSLVWNRSDWRFGPLVTMQSSSTSGYSSTTWNYGGFGQWFATPSIHAFGSATAFSGGMSSGFYVGASVNYYPMPDLAVNGGIGYSSYNNSGGYHEKDYTIGGEYLFSHTTPISLFGGYSVINYSTDYHAGQLFAGLKLYMNGEGVNTLADRQQVGFPIQLQTRF